MCLCVCVCVCVCVVWCVCVCVSCVRETETETDRQRTVGQMGRQTGCNGGSVFNTTLSLRQNRVAFCPLRQNRVAFCPLRQNRVALPGYGTATARAALPIPISMCSTIVCQEQRYPFLSVCAVLLCVKSSATHSYQYVQYYCVSKQWHDPAHRC